MVYGMEKFNHYTFGQKVTVHSGYKPLENIVRKPLLSAPKRLQCMLLRHIFLSNTLSRAYLPECLFTSKVEAEIETVNIVSIFEERLNMICSFTQKYKTLETLSATYRRDGRSIKNTACYYLFQKELSVQNGIIIQSRESSFRTHYRERLSARSTPLTWG